MFLEKTLNALFVWCAGFEVFARWLLTTLGPRVAAGSQAGSQAPLKFVDVAGGKGALSVILAGSGTVLFYCCAAALLVV